MFILLRMPVVDHFLENLRLDKNVQQRFLKYVTAVVVQDVALPASSEKPTCATLYFLDLANFVHFNRANVLKVRPEYKDMGFHILDDV